jgi:hypothetical protein
MTCIVILSAGQVRSAPPRERHWTPTPDHRKHIHRRTDVHRIGAEAIEFGHHEQAAGPEPVQVGAEARPLRCHDTAGNGFGDYAARLHGKPDGDHFPNLVVGGLAGRRDGGIDDVLVMIVWPSGVIQARAGIEWRQAQNQILDDDTLLFHRPASAALDRGDDLNRSLFPVIGAYSWFLSKGTSCTVDGGCFRSCARS